MRVNISKYKSVLERIEYLVSGYWITRQDIQPIRNKVEVILDIKAPKTSKQEKKIQLHHFWYSQILLQHIVS
jgi:hypothetical protein